MAQEQRTSWEFRDSRGAWLSCRTEHVGQMGGRLCRSSSHSTPQACRGGRGEYCNTLVATTHDICSRCREHIPRWIGRDWPVLAEQFPQRGLGLHVDDWSGGSWNCWSRRSVCS